jgi:hypothetical protein
MSQLQLPSRLLGKIHLLYPWVSYESAKSLAHRMSSMFPGEPEIIKIDKHAKPIKVFFFFLTTENPSKGGPLHVPTHE